jgi:hypothetical protein
VSDILVHQSLSLLFVDVASNALRSSCFPPFLDTDQHTGFISSLPDPSWHDRFIACSWQIYVYGYFIFTSNAQITLEKTVKTFFSSDNR